MLGPVIGQVNEGKQAVWDMGCQIDVKSEFLYKLDHFSVCELLHHRQP
jgi:hypothetical protein